MKGKLSSGRARVALPVLAAMLASLFFWTGPQALGGQCRPNAAPWPQINLVRVASGVSQPVHIANAGDGSGRLFIVERGGRIRLFKQGSLVGTPFLDIADRVSAGGSEQGLLSVAFPPQYASRGRFYVYYTDLAGNIVVARYFLTGNPDVADPNSEQIVLTIPHPAHTNHNGGQLAFGPQDGYLYAGTGDGGGGGDPDENAQDPASLLGKLLRIDVETGDPLTYTIPPGNPYTQTVGYLGEIWALGLRNPWRFSFDRQTADLYIGDVGQGAREEVDFQAASSPGGENYGWDILEGTLCYEPPSGCTPPSRYAPPVAEYDHSQGCSITGGLVYRGTAYPAWQGIYFYTDFCSGQIWGLQQDGGNWIGASLLDGPDFALTSFGEDEAGNLYLTHYTEGSIYEIRAPFVIYLPIVTRG